MRFLAGPARTARRVFILGDLFEVWIGDDSGLRDYAMEVEALRALVRYGVPVHFQHGNRDFLVGRAFAAATGVQMMTDPVVMDLEGQATLLSHGDIFCSDDVGYQRWRRFSRNKLAQWIFRQLPQERRRRIAGSVRGKSDAGKQMKAESIMDVNADAIAAAFRQYSVTRLIHGHTHRPAEHATCEGQRIVLADWRLERMEYLRADNSGCRRLLL